MSYTIDYSKYPTAKRRELKALRDCRKFLGWKRYIHGTKTINELMDEGYRRDFIIQSLHMVGITGYPAVVWVNHVAANRVPVQLKLDI